MSRRYGTGSVYKRSGCKTWTIKFYQNGRCIRESTGEIDYQAARQKLNSRLGQIANGAAVDLHLDRVSVADLAQDLIRDYRVNGRKSIGHVEARWELHLQPFLGHLRAAQISTNTLNQYVDHRKQQGAANGTINRELAALKRAFNLGYRSTPRRVQQVPTFPHLKENPPRKGFATEEQYAQLCKNCDEPWLRAMLAVAYSFGNRKSELLNLRVRQFNPFARTLALDPGATKNDEARTVYLTHETYELLKACVRGKQADAYVFTRDDGRPVKDCRVSWYKLCLRSGLGEMRCPQCLAVSTEYKKRCKACKVYLSYQGLLLHDQRRSAVRNMVRRGVPERVAMAISGHKTRSIFDRYNITSDADLAAAARRIEEGKASEFGHDFGHDAPPKPEPGKIHRVV
jgi:integrase